MEKHSADSGEKHVLAAADDQQEPVVRPECDVLEISVQFANQTGQDCSSR